MGINTSLTRLYGRAEGKARAIGTIPRNRGKNQTVISVIGIRGIISSMQVEGGVDTEVFKVFLKDFLLENIHKNDVLVMDNLKVHTSAWVKKLIESTGAKVIFLPPYSPDFSPIELCWSKMKSILRKLKARTLDSLSDALSTAFNLITSTDIISWYNHCGYSVALN